MRQTAQEVQLALDPSKDLLWRNKDLEITETD